MERESKLQTDVLNDLRSFGKYCVCTKIMKASDNGIPDIYLTLALTGSIFIETKRLIGKAAKIQKNKIKKMNECGTRAFICHSWEEWMDIKSKLHITFKNIKKAHDGK